MLCRGPEVALFTLNGDLLLEQHICAEGDEMITACAFYEGSGSEYLQQNLVFTGHRRGVVNVCPFSLFLPSPLTPLARPPASKMSILTTWWVKDLEHGHPRGQIPPRPHQAPEPYGSGRIQFLCRHYVYLASAAGTLHGR